MIAPRITALAVIAALLYVGFLAARFDGAGAFWFGLFAFPFCIGFATQLMLDPEVKLGYWPNFGRSCIVTGVLAVVVLVFAIEALLCVLMALPIFAAVQAFGVLVARVIFARVEGRGNGAVKSSLLIIPFALAVYKPSLPLGEAQYVVTNEISIEAAPEQIWAQINDFAQVQPSERLWTWSHAVLGAPMAERSFIEGDVRQAIWTQNVAYEEHLTERSPTRMAWDIAFADGFRANDMFQRILPNSEQFELLRGRYELEFDGVATTVTLSTEYRLKTAMNGYVALWGKLFLGDNHNSILHILKLRSEQAT